MVGEVLAFFGKIRASSRVKSEARLTHSLDLHARERRTDVINIRSMYGWLYGCMDIGLRVELDSRLLASCNIIRRYIVHNTIIPTYGKSFV
jgi:hypothetical protein